MSKKAKISLIAILVAAIFVSSASALFASTPPKEELSDLQCMINDQRSTKKKFKIDNALLKTAVSGNSVTSVQDAYYEVTKAQSGKNYAVYHSEPSGKSTSYSINVGTRITVVAYTKNSSNNLWYKFKNGSNYRWIYSDYIKYRGTISNYSKMMETTNGGKYWTQPWSSDTSRYTSSGSFGNGKVIKVSQKINRNGTIWYKLNNESKFIYSGNVKTHSCSSTTISKSNYKSVNSSQHSYDYKTRKCSNSSCPNYSSTSNSKGTENHSFQNGICSKCKEWKIKSSTSVSNDKYVVISDNTKVHSGPYGACNTTGYLSKGKVITVTQSVKNYEDNTWYKCSSGYVYSSYVKKHDTCTWNSGTYTKQPTCTESGTKKYTCTVCGATKTTTVKALGHNGYVCSRCGYWSTSSFKSTSALNNEKYVVSESNAKIHSGPYGATSTVSNPAKGTVITVTQRIVNGENNTWYKCNGGYIYSDYVKKHTSCTWNSGVYVTKPTCTASGTKQHTCTLCGATKTSTVKPLGHTKDFVCKRCGYWSSSSLKSIKSLKNVKYVVSSSDAKIHSGPYGATKTVSTPAKGTTITVNQQIVNGENNTWFRCGQGKYIYSKYVTKYELYYATTTLNCSSATVYRNTSRTLKATVKGPSKKVTWSSSNKGIATVNSSGVVKAVKVGTCTITATANGKKATCKITVKNPSIKLDSKVTVYTYGTKTLNPKVDGPSKTVKWKTNNAKIATVNKNGVITPKKLGTCKITATANGVSAVCTVTVAKPSIKLDISSITLYCNQEITIKPTVRGNYTTVKWSSNNNSIATVNAKGIVTASGNKNANGKSCTITATANGVKATCTVKVKYDTEVSYQKVNFVIDKVSGSTTLNYRSAWFANDSLNYSHDISKLASQLVMLGYADNKAVKGALEKMGFLDVVQLTDTKRNEVNYYMAHRIIKINGKSYNLLIAGFIGSYYHQWYSNFDPKGIDRFEDAKTQTEKDKIKELYAKNESATEIHLGFADAREFIYSKLTKGSDPYINKLNNGLETKVFIAGHSRGAATANLLGAKLIKEEKIGSLPVKMSNIFTYTYATPNVATVKRIKKDEIKSGMYNRIFNIVNPEDFVTKVIPKEWNYSRYGISYSLPNQSKLSKDAYNKYLNNMKKYFSVLSTTKDYKPYKKGEKKVNEIISIMTDRVNTVDEMYGSNGKTFRSNKGKMSVYKFFKTALCPTVVKSKTQYTSKDKELCDEATSFLLSQASNKISNDVYTYDYYLYTEIAAFFVDYQGIGDRTNGVISDTYFEDAHIAQTYCAYMLSLSGQEVKTMK